jgi:energy-coupling factor transporter transmembrane protein EcfT
MVFTAKYQWLLWPTKLALAVLVLIFLASNLVWQVNLTLAVFVTVLAFIYFKYRWLFWGTVVVGLSSIALIYFVLLGSRMKMPEATAQYKITQLEYRRDALIPLLQKAEDEKTDLVEKLKDAGIAKASDLKNIPSARHYAVSLAKVSKEIESIKDNIGQLEEAIASANSIIRQTEQSKVQISDEDLAKLTVVSGANSTPTTLDPANLDALLAKELNGAAPSTKHRVPSGQNTPVKSPKITEPSTTHLVSGPAKLNGNWEILKNGYGGKKVYLEFTKQGSVIFRMELLENIGKYTLSGSQLTLTDKRGKNSNYALEFASDGKSVLMRDEDNKYSDFNNLEGRWTKSK